MERPPGVLEVKGSIPVGDREFFIVPHTCHFDQFTYHNFCFVYISDIGRRMESQTLLNLLVSTRAVIGQFSGPYSPVRPAKI